MQQETKEADCTTTVPGSFIVGRVGWWDDDVQAMRSSKTFQGTLRGNNLYITACENTLIWVQVDVAAIAHCNGTEIPPSSITGQVFDIDDNAVISGNHFDAMMVGKDLWINNYTCPGFWMRLSFDKIVRMLDT